MVDEAAPYGFRVATKRGTNHQALRVAFFNPHLHFFRAYTRKGGACAIAKLATHIKSKIPTYGRPTGSTSRLHRSAQNDACANHQVLRVALESRRLSTMSAVARLQL